MSIAVPFAGCVTHDCSTLPMFCRTPRAASRVVTNGIAMCKIHHAAYDVDIFGISPTYKVGVRPDVM